MPRHFALLTLCFFLSVPAFAAVAVEDLGAHRMRGMDEFQQVIDTKCTVCHTRERVDIAIKKRQDLEKIQKRMQERGAVLSESDKRVLGTFWGSPLKEPETPAK
jgi:cytochrome c peroxidase